MSCVGSPGFTLDSAYGEIYIKKEEEEEGEEEEMDKVEEVF